MASAMLVFDVASVFYFYECECHEYSTYHKVRRRVAEERIA